MPVIELNVYDFRMLNGKNPPYLEDSFIKSYVNGCYEFGHVCATTEILRTILDAKY